jgi:phosphoglycolate phosphatase
MSLPWGIVTNKPEDLTRALLPEHPIFSGCEVLVCGDTLAHKKPSPEPMWYAAKQLQIAPTDIWYVGDALRDIQAARSAGMPSIIASYGYVKPADDLTKWNADFIVESTNHLNHILKEASRI